MQIDIEKVEALLKEGKTEEAKKVIAGSLAGNLSEDEKGSLLIAAAEVYARAVTQVNNAYVEKIKAALTELRSINTASDSLKDAARVSALRADLQ